MDNLRYGKERIAAILAHKFRIRVSHITVGRIIASLPDPPNSPNSPTDSWSVVIERHRDVTAAMDFKEVDDLGDTQALNRALKEAGIEDFRFHDLRHTAVSHLAMNGCAPLADIAGILGHKTLQMVQRYAHLRDRHTASVHQPMFCCETVQT